MNAHPSFPDASDDHPPVERLADLAEGLIDSPDAAGALHRHLDGCAECRETVDALAEVRALLGDVEAPPMPADVAARLDAALAEAAADAAGGDHDSPAADRRTDRPVPAATAPVAPSSPPSPPPPPPTPARPGDGRAGRSGAATGPGRTRPRRRRFALLLGAAAALAALGLGGTLLLHPDDRSGTVTASVGGAPAATADGGSARAPHTAGTDYREDTLAAQVQQLLARAQDAPGLRATGPAASGPSGGAGSGGSLLPADGARPEPDSPSPTGPGCPAPAPGTPLATDRGSYRGAPVDVLVYPLPDRPGSVDVYLRSPDCGPVLLHQAVPSR
ncbi:hypothetical protein ABZW03_35465 [Kitasatospora sp. NPDC004799]|uniref:hypothetical protein n=1 Tax=Kitasatospora sp. NPDC004799 TaxID=3154460 RepID=UPI0033B51B12